MGRLFAKACCSATDAATLSPGWTQEPRPASASGVPSTPAAGRAAGVASSLVHLELEAVPLAALRSPVARAVSWTPAATGGDAGTPPADGARPATPVVLAAAEWGPKAWQSPRQRQRVSDTAAPGEGASLHHCSLDSPELENNAQRVAASLERAPSLPTPTPEPRATLAPVDPNTWLSRQGSKGKGLSLSRQETLPVTPDIFAAGGLNTPRTVDVMLTPSESSAHSAVTAMTEQPEEERTPSTDAAPRRTPVPFPTVLLPRGARLLLRASQPTPAKVETRAKVVHRSGAVTTERLLWGALALLVSLTVAGASYALLSRGVPPQDDVAIALVPFPSPPRTPSDDVYLLTHIMPMMFIPACASLSMPLRVWSHQDADASLALYGVCAHGVDAAAQGPPRVRIPGLHPAVTPALRVDTAALGSVARNAVVAVAHAVGSVQLPATTLPKADMCGIVAVMLAAAYCGARLVRWNAMYNTGAPEAATPQEAHACSCSVIVSASEADSDVASLRRRSSDGALATPAHPRALSFSRADAAMEELAHDGQPSVMQTKRGRPSKRTATHAPAVPEPRVTRLRAARR